MKKIAFITDGWERYVTYAWIQGYRRYMAEHPLTADLYVFHSFLLKKKLPNLPQKLLYLLFLLWKRFPECIFPALTIRMLSVHWSNI